MIPQAKYVFPGDYMCIVCMYVSICVYSVVVYLYTMYLAVY